MDEQEWLTGTDAAAMLDALGVIRQSEPVTNRPMLRKLRLFAAACCRQVWHLLTDPRSLRAVEVAERYADGGATRRELNYAHLEAFLPSTRGGIAGNNVEGAAHFCAYAVAHQAATATLYRLAPDPAQAALLRCLFGNPWRSANLVSVRWGCNDVLKIAGSIYAYRDFAAMSVLADALEEAGCTDAAALAHCREPLHARGCWVLDLILGKG